MCRILKLINNKQLLIFFVSLIVFSLAVTLIENVIVLRTLLGVFFGAWFALYFSNKKLIKECVELLKLLEEVKNKKFEL